MALFIAIQSNCTLKMVNYWEPYSTCLETALYCEYDQEIPQLQTEDNPVAPQGRVAQPSRDTRKTN